MGLSQLYQLRGRVGRSNKIAHAYITYRKDKVINENAEKRLKAIKEFTSFGSGFKIAMRDLEIRGAGNLFGSRQHGHIESVGYDMYVRLLSEAVGHLTGTNINEEEKETLVDLEVNAFISDKYIVSDMQRLDAYKKISSVTSQKEVYDIKEELEDRYGDVQKEFDNLIDIALIKHEAMKLKIEEIGQKDKFIVFSFNKFEFDIKPYEKLFVHFKNKIKFNMAKNPQIMFEIDKTMNIIENVKFLLTQF